MRKEEIDEATRSTIKDFQVVGMPEQEDIRVGIEDIIASYHNGVPFVDEAPEILRYLKSKGVVRKAERELPKDEDYDYYEDEAFDDGQRSVIEAGYVAVEDLI